MTDVRPLREYHQIIDAEPVATQPAVRPVGGSGYGLGGLVDALDGLINTGACVVGDVVISVAGVDLVQINLRAVIAAVSEQEPR